MLGKDHLTKIILATSFYMPSAMFSDYKIAH